MVENTQKQTKGSASTKITKAVVETATSQENQAGDAQQVDITEQLDQQEQEALIDQIVDQQTNNAIDQE